MESDTHQRSFCFAEAYCGPLGQRLLDECARHGLTMYALARRSGVTREMIARIIRGQSCPTVFTLSRLAFALELMTSELLALVERDGVASKGRPEFSRRR